MVVGAAPVGKARGALQVVRERKQPLAAWTGKVCGERISGGARLTNELEQSQYGLWGEPPDGQPINLTGSCGEQRAGPEQPEPSITAHGLPVPRPGV
jgi:hypothetical protein